MWEAEGWRDGGGKQGRREVKAEGGEKKLTKTSIEKRV